MSEYKNPRPSPSASASDPCVVYDNSVSFDKLINESEVVITYKGVELQSVPSLLDQIESEANAAVISLGWHQVGLFADGFTYTLQNDIAKDANGDWYRWNGALPKIVTAGTLPSSDANFVKIDYKSHAELSDRNPADGSAHNADDIKDTTNGGSVQDFIDAQHTTALELETGKFQVGEFVILDDRAGYRFKLQSGGVANGFDILDAGNSNTAVLQGRFITDVAAFGCASDLEFTTDANGVVLSESGTDNSDAWQAAANWSAANKSIIAGTGKGYRFGSHGVIMKSGTNIVINKATYLMQDYQMIVEPKSESLFRNESWNTANTDADIHISGGCFTSGSTITNGSYITLNKLERFSVIGIYCRKFTENSCLNIGGKDFFLSNIHIINKDTDTGKIDGIHFEYIENATGGDFIIESQDDCLGFAYFPAIIPPRSPAEAIANVTHGRDLPSRNISFTGGSLKSKIANAVRVGNWANFQDLNQYMMPEGRYENLILNGFACNKTGITGTLILLEDYRHGASEITEPHNNIEFNGFIVNDYTSATESLISVRGNAFLKGFYDYATAGNDRNFKNVSLNGFRGDHASLGSTYDLNGASKITLNDCDIKRSVASNNELITQLVDSVVLQWTFINSNAASATGNGCFFRDFKEVIINGGAIVGNGLEIAAVRLQQPNLGDIGRVIINDTIMRGTIGGVHSVSALELEQLTVNADMTGISGSATNNLLTSRSGNRQKPINFDSTAAYSSGECRVTGVTGVASFIFTVASVVPLNTKIADFPAGCKPSHDTPEYINIINTSGTNYLIDYSSTVGLRVRAAAGLPAGTYHVNFAYRAKG